MYRRSPMLNRIIRRERRGRFVALFIDTLSLVALLAGAIWVLT